MSSVDFPRSYFWLQYVDRKGQTLCVVITGPHATAQEARSAANELGTPGAEVVAVPVPVGLAAFYPRDALHRVLTHEQASAADAVAFHRCRSSCQPAVVAAVLAERSEDMVSNAVRLPAQTPPERMVDSQTFGPEPMSETELAAAETHAARWLALDHAAPCSCSTCSMARAVVYLRSLQDRTRFIP